MDTVTAGAAIVGIVNLVKRQFPQVSGIYGVVLAVALGAVGGYLNLYGLDVQTGVTLGFASSGVYETAVRVGGN